MKNKKESGFSLIETLVGLGLAGGLALFITHLVKNSNDAQRNTQVKAEEQALSQEIRQILYDQKHCRISFAGNGTPTTPTTPVKFFKNLNDDKNDTANGLNVELFLATPDGTARSQKKFSAITSPANTYGHITIKSMKLYFTNGKDYNYPESIQHQDIAELEVVIDKKMANNSREIKLNFDINLDLKTDALQETTIIGCSNNAPSVNVSLTACYDVNAPTTHSYNLKCNDGDILISQSLKNDWTDSEWNKHQYVNSIRCCKARAGANLLAIKNCVTKDVLVAHNQNISCDPNMVLTGIGLKNDWTDSEWNKHQYVRSIQCCEVSF